jgi:diguanylate cyclase (GGDEF)-like protein
MKFPHPGKSGRRASKRTPRNRRPFSCLGPAPEEVIQNEPTSERRVFLSIAAAGRRERQFALAAVLASALVFAAAAPFAKMALAQINAFIPAYESALVICDLITAVLLFGQFSFLRSRALFVLASGYMFTASIAFVHALTFPEVFSRSGLLGAGPQTTAWLYMSWHGGFPLFVILYALVGRERHDPGGTGGAPRSDNGGLAIPCGVFAILAITCGLTLFATLDQGSLPVLIVSNHFTALMTAVVSSVLGLTLVALLLVWRRRPHSVLDLWLMVVMCAWLFDVGLSAVFNASRFDLGWYAGRIYGLLAASSLLVVLLAETGTHYARLALLSDELKVANTALEELSLRDGLTNLANRRFFDTYLAAQIAVARRHGRPMALVLCDVDAFKAYNDHYGHQAGDECLRRVANALQSCCHRPADMVARYGGEEFAMILPDTSSTGAGQLAEAARDAVAQLKIPHARSPIAPYVSISGGVAVLPDDHDVSAQQLIMAADESLYRAKRLGRNRMVHAPAAPGREYV